MRIDASQFTDLDTKALNIKGKSLSGSHTDGKNVHTTMIEKRIIEETDSYQIEYSWTYCQKCRSILSKTLTGWNNVDVIAYTKKFI